MPTWVNQPYLDKMLENLAREHVMDLRSERVIERLSRITTSMLAMKDVSGVELRIDETPILPGYKILVYFGKEVKYTVETIIPVMELSTNLDTVEHIVNKFKETIGSYLNLGKE